MANQALQNLKRIHDLQKDGEISKILQELRASKVKVEELSANLTKRNKEIELELASKQQKQEVNVVEEKKETPKEVQVTEITEVEPVFVDRKPQEREQNNNYRKFDNINSKNYNQNIIVHV